MTGAPIRQRSRTEIDHDLIAACRRMGEIALGSELSLQAPDHAEIGRIAEGVRRTLIERESTVEGSNNG